MFGLARVACLALLCQSTVGCSHPRPTPTPVDPWRRLQPSGAPVALWSYPESIARYAPDDRGAYVVRIRGESTERRAIATALGASDDIVGDDGYVVRLDAVDAAAVFGRPGVIAIAPLQPSDRSGTLFDRTAELPEVRIDLFADVTADEMTAMVAWVTWRGGQVLWHGRAALRARLPFEARTDAARLSIVRWIE